VTKLNETEKKPKYKATVIVPVRATISVPIEIEHDDETLIESVYGEMHGALLVDVQEHNEVLEKVVAKVIINTEIKDAIERLAESLTKHKRKYPEAKTYYTWYAGVQEEQEI